MNNPVCAVCGHVNQVGAVACEACDARFYTAGEPGTTDSFGDTYEPFDSTGYIYLGLLREHRSGFQAGAFTPGPEAAVG